MAGNGRQQQDQGPRQDQPGRGQPVPDHETKAEQLREARESREAHEAQSSNRERMVDIGRGNQQAGRQSQ